MPRRQQIYEPRRITATDPMEMLDQVQKEFDRISEVLIQIAEMKYLPQALEPPKFDQGSLQFFLDGVAVDGIGSTEKGMHQYRDGSWFRLLDGGNVFTGDTADGSFLKIQVPNSSHGWALATRTVLPDYNIGSFQSWLMPMTFANPPAQFLSMFEHIAGGPGNDALTVMAGVTSSPLEDTFRFAFRDVLSATADGQVRIMAIGHYTL